MSRPWQVGLLFGLSVAVLLAAMAWISRTTLRLERGEQAARERAALEENVRLALWRMESELRPLIAHESARPREAYATFYSAHGQLPPSPGEQAERCGDVRVASPLLVQSSPNVLLHFQFSPDDELSSPQAPTGADREAAVAPPVNASLVRILAAELRLDELKRFATRDELLEQLPETPLLAAPGIHSQLVGNTAYQTLSYQQRVQSERNNAEWAARQSAAVQVQSFDPQTVTGVADSDDSEGILKPIWVGNSLLLARRVSINGGTFVQGCWLNWPNLERQLLARISDLLPHARLEPAPEESSDSRDRRLAALPVRLVPGTIVFQTDQRRPTVLYSLTVAWTCVLLAATAVGVLLIGTVRLSERRGAFVSAVTHEMRTPLTTFRLYTELLSTGMVRDEAKQRKYLETLRGEAVRLGHLVENVLAYARLERGRATGRSETLGLGDLLTRVEGRLAERAEQAGMRLTVDGNGTREVRVRADVSVVEQILLNLVDNACKYANSRQDSAIQICAERRDGHGVLRVVDHGPGLSRADARRLFRPFRKSARDAAHSAPGVGLGLALSRRLARDMGGDLRLEEPGKPGAQFALALPLE